MFPLNFRHLTDRMFFARDAKQHSAERNSRDSVAEEKSHNALARLSASLVTCKPKAREFLGISIAINDSCSGVVSNAQALAAASACTKD